MRWRGRRNWPPQWKGKRSLGGLLPEPEAGVLIRVEPGLGDKKTPHCFLDIQWNDHEYFAVLFFDDAEFLQLICDTFNRHIGRPISEIGSLDIP